LREEENPPILWGQLAPGPPPAVLRKPSFLTGESTLSLKQKFLLLECVVRFGNANPSESSLSENLDLTVQQATYSVGGPDLGCTQVFITA